MGYTHLTIEERTSISFLMIKGASIRAIAAAIGRNPSTVKRELDRNHTPNRDGTRSYYPHSSQKRYEKRVSKAHNTVRFPLEVIQIIERRIRETWSPEQIAAFCKGQGLPCFKTIYKWIGEGRSRTGGLRRRRSPEAEHPFQ